MERIIPNGLDAVSNGQRSQLVVVERIIPNQGHRGGNHNRSQLVVVERPCPNLGHRGVNNKLSGGALRGWRCRNCRPVLFRLYTADFLAVGVLVHSHRDAVLGGCFYALCFIAVGVLVHGLRDAVLGGCFFAIYYSAVGLLVHGQTAAACGGRCFYDLRCGAACVFVHGHGPLPLCLSRVKQRFFRLFVGDCLGFGFILCRGGPVFRRGRACAVGYHLLGQSAVFGCNGFCKVLIVGAAVGCPQCCRSTPGSFGSREVVQNLIGAVSFLSADVQCTAALGLRLGKSRSAFKTLTRIIRRDIRRVDITRCNGFSCRARIVLILNRSRDGFPIDFSGDRYGLDIVLCTADFHIQQLTLGVSNRSAEGGAGDAGGIELHAVGALGTLGILGVEALLYLRHVRQPADRRDFKSGRGRRRRSAGARR